MIRGQSVLLYFQSFTRRFDRAEYAPRIAINQINAGDSEFPAITAYTASKILKLWSKGSNSRNF